MLMFSSNFNDKIVNLTVLGLGYNLQYTKTEWELALTGYKVFIITPQDAKL